MTQSTHLCSLTSLPIWDDTEVVAVAIRNHYSNPIKFEPSRVIENVFNIDTGIYNVEHEYIDCLPEPYNYPYWGGLDRDPNTRPRDWLQRYSLLYFYKQAWDEVVNFKLGADIYAEYSSSFLEREEKMAYIVGKSPDAIDKLYYPTNNNMMADDRRWVEIPLHEEFCHVVAFCYLVRQPMIEIAQMHTFRFFEEDLFRKHQILRGNTLDYLRREVYEQEKLDTLGEPIPFEEFSL